jgi:hypothetical protein
MISGLAPTERRSFSSSEVILKATPRDWICETSSCVERPLILTACINPCFVMGFLPCIRALPDRKRNRESTVTTKVMFRARLNALLLDGITPSPELNNPTALIRFDSL